MRRAASLGPQARGRNTNGRKGVVGRDGVPDLKVFVYKVLDSGLQLLPSLTLGLRLFNALQHCSHGQEDVRHVAFKRFPWTSSITLTYA